MGAGERGQDTVNERNDTVPRHSTNTTTSVRRHTGTCSERSGEWGESGSSQPREISVRSAC